MTRWIVFSLAACVAATIVALGFDDTPAKAHNEYQRGYVYSSATNCTWSRADKGHGSGGGYNYAFTRSRYAQWTPYGDLHCGRN